MNGTETDQYMSILDMELKYTCLDKQTSDNQDNQLTNKI